MRGLSLAIGVAAALLLAACAYQPPGRGLDQAVRHAQQERGR